MLLWTLKRNSLCYSIETPSASPPILLLCLHFGQFALFSDACSMHYAASFQQAKWPVGPDSSLCWPLQIPEHTCHLDVEFLMAPCSMYCFHWFALVAWGLAELPSLPLVLDSLSILIVCILLLKPCPVTLFVNDSVSVWTGQIYARNGIAETASPLVEEQAEELADCEGLVVRVRGDGQVYCLVLTTGDLQIC